VGPEGVVFHSPPFDEYLGLPKDVKDLSIVYVRGSGNFEARNWRRILVHIPYVGCGW
jgi:hypothetical protein